MDRVSRELYIYIYIYIYIYVCDSLNTLSSSKSCLVVPLSSGKSCLVVPGVAVPP